MSPTSVTERPVGTETLGQRLLVFVTEVSAEATSGPILFIEERPDAVLPDNPRGLTWRYFATIGREDAMVAAERDEVEHGLRDDGYYISNRLI
jgi:hypothetical protein